MSVITSDRLDGVYDGVSSGSSGGDTQTIATPVTDASSAQVVTGALVGKDSREGLTYNQVEATPNGALEVNASNIVTKFREAFETYTPGDRWVETKANGDLIFLDGNTASASYLVISKSPLTQGTESSIETITKLKMPLELSTGVSISQRTLGQEISVEIVDTDTPLADVPDIQIANIRQTTTTVIVSTVTPHNLAVGKGISIYGINDSRLNYPSLVVATVAGPNDFTATGGPFGTLPSLNIPIKTEGYVRFRERLGRANNGMSQIFENVTATNASMYVRSEKGDALPSGVIAGNHSVTVATTASGQLAGTSYSFSFTPSSEFRMSMQADRVQWYDIPIDSVGQSTNRAFRTQVCPNPDILYKLRYRATNNKSLTIPKAKIVTAVKTGTTTATITTDVPHGLTTQSVVNIYGIRNQAATAFPNLTVATAVASIVSPTVFTIVIGTASTVTSYGGLVAEVLGGNLMSALGANTGTGVSAEITDGILKFNTAGWTILPYGTIIELYGVRADGTGADLGVDGPWRIRHTSVSELHLEPMGWTPPASLALTNCGGAFIQRTDLRIHFVRLFDYDRLRIEALNRPSGDSAGGMPVNIQASVGLPATMSGVWNTGISVPLIVADVASAALTTTTTTATITPASGGAYEVNIPVTVVTGTNPTLDVTIEESDDTGINWYPVYSFPRITATGIYRSPKITLTGNRLRYVQTVSGTTPSFTRAINRLQHQIQVPEFRQLINRTIVLTTLNSVTPNLVGGNTKNVQLIVNTGAGATVEAQVQLEGSDDNGVTWVAIDTPLTTVLSSTVQKTVLNINHGLYRARVSTAGTGVTMGYVLVKAFV